MSVTPLNQLGREAIAAKGWLPAHRFLILRRLVQLGIFAVFLAGPLFGLWIVKGNLASSLTLDTLPLTDPFLLVQTLFSGHAIATTAVIGAAIVTLFYLLVGGRVYCAWVCPVNIITDLAEWLRNRLGIKSAGQLPRHTRYWLLGMVLVLALVTGTLVWELFNPATLVQRAIIFGVGFAWLMMLGIFVLDAFVSRRAWCGHLCPMGAFYSLLGRVSVLRVSAVQRNKCDDCMECFAICPEPQVITPALKGADKNIGPVILAPNCTNCGRCIDICSKQVFRFDHRFNNAVIPLKNSHQREVLP